jgi:hypothetical protein
MGILIVNEWNAIINLQNDIMKNIQNRTKKQIPSILALKKLGCYNTLAPLTPKQVYEDQIQLKKSYKEEHSDSAKMEEQAEQHYENMRKSENKVSRELKIKEDKVLALRKLGEGHDQKEKNRREAESEEKKERVRKEVCTKTGENP